MLKHILNYFKKQSIDYDIYILADTQIKTALLDESIIHADESEFFSRMEFSEIASALFNIFGFGKVFYSETEFIEYVIKNRPNRSECLVYNLSRDGIAEGKKSLIPAFCDLYNLRYTGSNAFVISLLRNKWTFSQILTNNNISVPDNIIYNDSTKIDTLDYFEGKKVIVKNIYESASQGLKLDNLFLFDNDYLSKIQRALENLQSNKVLIQEYIEGSECEIFVFQFKGNYYALEPVKLVFDSQTDFLDSSSSNSYSYTFKLLKDECTEATIENIKKIAVKSAKILNIKDYARFDFRIKGNRPYLIDIAGTPYTIKHSSIAYLFEQVYNLQYKDIFKVIVGCCLSNYNGSD